MAANEDKGSETVYVENFFTAYKIGWAWIYLNLILGHFLILTWVMIWYRGYSASFDITSGSAAIYDEPVHKHKNIKD